MAVGFGVKDAATARVVAHDAAADGVVVGSAFVNAVSRGDDVVEAGRRDPGGLPEVEKGRGAGAQRTYDRAAYCPLLYAKPLNR